MTKDLTTLGLQLPTDPRWAEVAEDDIEEILVDHAYCEQKAASSCISLIILFPEKDELVDMLTPVVAEEWTHFEMVINHLKKRGYSLGRARKDEYVSQINKLVKIGGSRNEQLVEKLLLNALIEARSAERFKVLSKNLKDPELSTFYHDLMVSEAGHYRNFLNLAKSYMPEDHVSRRWKYFLEEEAKIMKNMKTRSNRMH
ncbi:MAG: tRNA-(ms[2]io[6]A)-hydroxylase [Bacteroidota bacterium]